MARVYLGVGSNLGDRSFYLEQAKELLKKIPQTRFLRSSSVFETDPVGGPPQGKFLNAAWEIETRLSPHKLKEWLRQIEHRIGRRRTRSDMNMPREIDLDILSYGSQVIQKKDLKIPHPRLHERRFVLEPLCEIAPHWVHPLLKKTIKELFQEISERRDASPPRRGGRRAIL